MARALACSGELQFAGIRARSPVLLFLAIILLALCTGCVKHYKIEALILQVDPSARTILVSHRPIDGYMAAMTMPFHVAPQEDLSTLAPGTRVNFDLQVGKHASVARNLKPKVVKLEADGKEIRVDPPPNKIALGATVPDFSLTDQSNRTVHLSDFHGRVIAIDFIYTRCPLPDVCPRLSANFASVAKRLIAPTSGHDIQLLSITIDPQYDTPAVLTEYAHRYGADGQSWRFLTGSLDQIREVAGIFGLVYWPEEGSITHTVSTAVIGRDGKLAALINGSSYRPEQLRDLIQHTLDADVGPALVPASPLSSGLLPTFPDRRDATLTDTGSCGWHRLLSVLWTNEPQAFFTDLSVQRPSSVRGRPW